MTGAKIPRKPGPVFDHSTREKAIRLVIKMLQEGSSTPHIRDAVTAGASKDAGRPIDVSRRTVETLISMARARMREHFDQDLSEAAAHQVAVLETIQQESLKAATPSAYAVAIRACHRICRIKGLDRPLDIRQFVEAQERLKDNVIEALRSVSDDPKLLRRFAEQLASRENEVQSPKKAPAPAIVLDEDLEDYAEEIDE
jgi:hypothetical protein